MRKENFGKDLGKKEHLGKEKELWQNVAVIRSSDFEQRLVTSTVEAATINHPLSTNETWLLGNSLSLSPRDGCWALEQSGERLGRQAAAVAHSVWES